MSPVIWILIGAVLLACLGGGKGKKKPEAGGPVRIDHPHYFDEDDHECSVCGARFTGSREDDGEFMEEMELWEGDED